MASPPPTRRVLRDLSAFSSPGPGKDCFSIDTCSTACPSSGLASQMELTPAPPLLNVDAQDMGPSGFGSLAQFFAPWPADGDAWEPALVTPAPALKDSHSSAPPKAPGAPDVPHVLYKALVVNDQEAVREALAAAPDSATEPFWNHGLEPPLCVAVTNRCSPDIFATLLQSGADVHQSTVWGATPMDMLCKAKPIAEWERWDVAVWTRVQQLLLDAGAIPAADAETPCAVRVPFEDLDFPPLQDVPYGFSFDSIDDISNDVFSIWPPVSPYQVHVEHSHRSCAVDASSTLRAM